MTASQNFPWNIKLGREAATHIHAAACNPHHRVTSRAYCFSWGHVLFQAGAAPQRKLKKISRPPPEERTPRMGPSQSVRQTETTHLSLVTSICASAASLYVRYTGTESARVRANIIKLIHFSARAHQLSIMCAKCAVWFNINRLHTCLNSERERASANWICPGMHKSRLQNERTFEV